MKKNGVSVQGEAPDTKVGGKKTWTAPKLEVLDLELVGGGPDPKNTDNVNFSKSS